MTSPCKLTRRTFLKSSAAVAACSSPLFLHASDKSSRKTPVVGKGEFRYEVQHNWGQLPDHIQWGDTHGVTVDAEGLIYIKHRSTTKEPMDAIAVFDSRGKFVRSFGKEFHRGGHGIDLRKEGGEEFLYLSDIHHGVVVKATLKGERVWKIGRPKQEFYKKNPKARYSPTNLAFAPDGGFYVGDGYGSHFVQHYNAKAELIRSWGGRGKEAGKLSTPHGIWLDDRPGRPQKGLSAYWDKADQSYVSAETDSPEAAPLDKPTLVVADRANARLQYFTLEGEHIGFINGLSFPADIDIQGDIMLVPDLHARITLFDRDNKVITHLGYDPEWTKKVLANGLRLRRNAKNFKPGKFLHPHDACFDSKGNIYVAEWVPRGRVSFLKKVS